jgi:hypothetical protein
MCRYGADETATVIGATGEHPPRACAGGGQRTVNRRVKAYCPGAPAASRGRLSAAWLSCAQRGQAQPHDQCPAALGGRRSLRDDPGGVQPGCEVRAVSACCGRLDVDRPPAVREVYSRPSTGCSLSARARARTPCRRSTWARRRPSSSTQRISGLMRRMPHGHARGRRVASADHEPDAQPLTIP